MAKEFELLRAQFFSDERGKNIPLDSLPEYSSQLTKQFIDGAEGPIAFLCVTLVSINPNKKTFIFQNAGRFSHLLTNFSKKKLMKAVAKNFHIQAEGHFGKEKE